MHHSNATRSSGGNQGVLEAVLTIREVAEMERVSTGTVKNMLAEGVFPDAYLTGTGKGAWRIPARNLADFRKSRSARPVEAVAPLSPSSRRRKAVLQAI